MVGWKLDERVGRKKGDRDEGQQASKGEERDFCMMEERWVRWKNAVRVRWEWVLGRVRNLF